MGWGRVGSRTPYFTRTYRRCVPGLESKSSSAAQSSKTHFSSHTDLSWWCHLFRGERRTRFYFRIFAHDHQDVRIQSVFFWMPSLSLPPLMYSCGMVTQLTRLPSYSQYLPMLSQLSSSQSPPGYPTASSPADFSSSSQARWAEPDICKCFFFLIFFVQNFFAAVGQLMPTIRYCTAGAVILTSTTPQDIARCRTQ